MIEDQKKNFGIETNEQFEQALAASNMTLDDMRANMTRDILLQKVVGQEVHARISVDEEDLRRYYQNKLGTVPRGGALYGCRKSYSWARVD